MKPMSAQYRKSLLLFLCTVMSAALPSGAARAAESAPTVPPLLGERPAFTLGVNLSGAEFAPGHLPGTNGVHFGWTREPELDRWAAAGVRLVRLPFLWERLQPEPSGELAPAYAEGLLETVRGLAARGIWVIPDVHNYGRYRTADGEVHRIGRGRVRLEDFADLWRRLALLLHEEPNLWAYGLMNEPHLAGGGGIDWPACAQAAIDAIRTVDARTEILVANDYPGWAVPYQKGDLAAWAEKSMPIGDPAMLKDPADNIRFELHCYFDFDNSGFYKGTYGAEAARENGRRVHPNTGVERVRPFVEWLRKHQAKGLLGEFSVPANPADDPRWLDALENLLAYLRENRLPATYWGAGDRWSHGIGYVVSPRGWSKAAPEALRQKPRPQAVLLQMYNEPSCASEADRAWLATYRKTMAVRERPAPPAGFVWLDDFAPVAERQTPIYHLSKRWHATWAGNCAFWPVRDPADGTPALRTPVDAWGHECYFRAPELLSIAADAEKAVLCFRVKTPDDGARSVSIGLAADLQPKSANVPEKAMGPAIQVRNRTICALARDDVSVAGAWQPVAEIEPGQWVGIVLTLYPREKRYTVTALPNAAADALPGAAASATSFPMPCPAEGYDALLITTRGKGFVWLADFLAASGAEPPAKP